jgi:hypothetical protein
MPTRSMQLERDFKMMIYNSLIWYATSHKTNRYVIEKDIFPAVQGF